MRIDLEITGDSTMREFVVLSFAVFFSAVLCMSAVSAEVLGAPVTACINANAPKVEKVISSLSEATTFLADNVCAAEVNAEALRQTKLLAQRFTDEQKASCLAQQAKLPNPNPQNCDFIGTANPFSTLFDGPLSVFAPPRKLPDATELAAKTLLDLRLSHTRPDKKN